MIIVKDHESVILKKIKNKKVGKKRKTNSIFLAL